MSYQNEILVVSEHGEFYGQRFTPEDCELYMDTFVPPRLVAMEGVLAKKRWFDYRPQHAVINTFLFAHLYRKQYIHKTEQYFGHDKAKRAKGFSGEDIFQNSAALVCIWAARQHADRLTIPYDLYLSMAFDALYKRKWKRLPAASQLYAPATIEHIEAAWSERVENAPPMPKHEKYLAMNFQSTDTDVTDFQTWLLKIIDNAQNLTITLCHYLFNAQLLHPSTVVHHYGSDAFDSAARLYRRQTK